MIRSEHRFNKWKGEGGIEKFIINETGCKPYSGAGINPRIKNKTTILRSVDGTYFYDDNLNDVNIIKYTLYGHEGDQNECEKRFNEPLLNPEKTKHIYDYRKKENEYLWYGKYEIFEKNIKSHIGKDHIMRNIIVLTLKKIDDIN